MRSTFWALVAMLAGADTTPPSTPAQLYVASATSTSVSLRWRASTDGKRGSGLAGYDIFQNGSTIASTPSTTFTITELASSTTFQFAVRARDKAGNVSELGNAVSATTTANSCTAYPAKPAGLQVASVSSSTANLVWNAVIPPAGCGVRYNVYRDGTAIATGLSTVTYNASALLPSTAYHFAVSATDEFGGSGLSGLVGATTAAGGASNGFPIHLFAPYIDMLQYPTPSLSGIATATGQKYFSMAFVVAGHGCQATWGGYHTIAQNFEMNDVAALRAQGGDVIVSFGGADGTELALACSSVSALQVQYQAVIDKYNLTRVDFDIEGSALGNTTSIDRRNQVIAALQAAAASAGETLVVQYTLPVLPTGLTSEGMGVLQNALRNGVEIGIVNVMTMDYGSGYDPNQMGPYAVEAMNATIAQVAALYGAAKTDAEVRAMIGVTPEIGLNDVTPEVFTLGDASTVVSAAQSGAIGMLTFWSTGRDQQCPVAPVVSGTCSGVIQSPGAFTNIFRLFTEY